MREYPKGTSLDAEAFSSYVMERGGALVDSDTDPFVITVYRAGKAAERWELRKRRRGDVFWLRR